MSHDHSGMKRPYVICHMMSAVDGKIKTGRWSLSAAAQQQYEAVHQLHKADAWLCGRKTFQDDFLEQKRPATFSRKTKVRSGDFIADVQLPSAGPEKFKPVYAIAVDGSGKLRWESNDMRGDRLVVLTTAKAPPGYLADLRAKSISYLICGKTEVDFAAALRRLHRSFGIRKVMLEGGGGINGALLVAGVVDEISLLICPFADGSRQLPTVFDVPEKLVGKKATGLKLISMKMRPGRIVWLRYRVS